MQELHRHVRILGDLALIAGENQPLPRFLENAVVQVGRASGIDHVTILRYRRESGDLLIEAGLGWKEGVVGTVSISSDFSTPAGMTYRTGHPIVLPDCYESREFVIDDLLKDHGIQALATVPILTGGSAWGVLEVDSTERRQFTEAEIDFMRAAAAIIAQAVRCDTALCREREVAAGVLAQARSRQIMLREMQHRVKNNFQIILAAILMQKRRFPGEEVHRALDHIANRIWAVSLAHDQLAPRESRDVVDLAHYLPALCAAIEQQCENVSIVVNADNVELPIDRAVALGLIVNEAVTNSVKHAFDGAGGRVTVKLAAGANVGEAQLSVADNGKGFAGDDAGTGGAGLKIMAALAKQAGADVEHDSGETGTRVTVTFPIVG